MLTPTASGLISENQTRSVEDGSDLFAHYITAGTLRRAGVSRRNSDQELSVSHIGLPSTSSGSPWLYTPFFDASAYGNSVDVNAMK